MKAEIVRFLLPLAVLLACASLEEAVPQALGVGFPFLLTAALAFGSVRPRAEALLLAVLAGVLEDALAGLPLATTASFLILVVFCARSRSVARFAPLAAYPVYQFWLVVWTSLPAGALWGRLLVSAAMAAVATLTLPPVLLLFERRLTVDAR